MVLGHKIDAGGMKDGEEVLDLLARDPHTAHHIRSKSRSISSPIIRPTRW